MIKYRIHLPLRLLLLFSLPIWLINYSCAQVNTVSENLDMADTLESQAISYPKVVDSVDYFKKLKQLANGDTSNRWPVKQQPLPLSGALLPEHRIIAYYGNLYSKRMGILGELPAKEMIERLKKEVHAWNEADSSTKAIPALHYIAVTAQSEAGKDRKHRLRMPHQQIDSVLNIAKLNGNLLVFLDIQVALSSLQEELPRLESYLRLPQVHLGIDPEFSMKDGSKPGTRIGSFDAKDINYAANLLAKLVNTYQLPPKLLVVHRFTAGMVQHYRDIKLRPEVQVVIQMDGWGAPALKKATYRQFIYREPVQFTGFKLFYKNDLKQTPKRMLTPTEILQLKPAPSYIQYQ